MKKIWDSIAKDLWIVLLDIIALNVSYFLPGALASVPFRNVATIQKRPRSCMIWQQNRPNENKLDVQTAQFQAGIFSRQVFFRNRKSLIFIGCTIR